jgi:hypothetical protein
MKYKFKHYHLFALTKTRHTLQSWHQINEGQFGGRSCMHNCCISGLKTPLENRSMHQKKSIIWITVFFSFSCLGDSIDNIFFYISKTFFSKFLLYIILSHWIYFRSIVCFPTFIKHIATLFVSFKKFFLSRASCLFSSHDAAICRSLSLFCWNCTLNWSLGSTNQCTLSGWNLYRHSGLKYRPNL